MTTNLPSGFRPTQAQENAPSDLPSGFRPIEAQKTQDFSSRVDNLVSHLLTAGDVPLQFFKGRLKGALALPGNITKLLRTIGSKLPAGEVGEETKEKILNTIFPKGLTSADLDILEKEYFGEHLQPKAAISRIAEKGGEFVGGGLAKGSAAKPLAVSGMAGQSARELGLPEPFAIGAELFTPFAETGAKAVTKVLSKPQQGALREGLNAEQRAFYDSAKDLGLTDEQITPLLQSNKKIDILAPFAKKTKQTQEALLETKGGIGQIYNPIKKQAASHGNMSQEQLQELSSNLKNDLTNLRKTVKPGTEKAEAIDFLEDSLKNMEGNIISPKGEVISYKFRSPEELINFYQDINAQGLWKHLEPAKNTIRKSIYKIDKDLGKKFDVTNKSFSKLQDIRQKIGLPENMERLVKFGERAILLTALGKGLFFGGGYGLAASVLGENLARRVASKMLVDPRWQSIGNNFVKAVQQNSKAHAMSAYNQLKEKVKEEYPEDYDEIDWPED